MRKRCGSKRPTATPSNWQAYIHVERGENDNAREKLTEAMKYNQADRYSELLEQIRSQ